MRRKVRRWRELGAPLKVLRNLQRGVDLDFHTRPPPFNQGNSLENLSEEEQAWLDKEVSRNLGSGSWVAATIKTHVTKCFLVPKKVEPGQPKKWRLVIDLRHLNDFCRDKSCKFETLKSLRYLAKPGDWLISVDLQDGFHAIQVRPDHQKYFTFCLQGQYYTSAVLPFGWKGSPAVFVETLQTLTRALRTPAAPTTAGQPVAFLNYLREECHVKHRPRTALSAAYRSPYWAVRLRVLPYMDDYLFLFRSKAEAEAGALQIRATFEYLGLKINEEKSPTLSAPTQELRHLGLLVNTVRGLFLVPKDKERRIRTMARGLKVQALSNRRLLPARLLASFTGLCQSVYLAVPYARLYLRSLHDDLSQKAHWEANVRLSRQSLRDLQWWADLRDQYLGRALWRSPDQAELHSDSSGFAWGGQLDYNLLAQGIWTLDEKRHHITVLELLAVLRNVQAFLPRLRSKTILLHEDNQAVCHILRNFTSRSPVIMLYLRKLILLLDTNNITLRPVYIRSEDNPADAPSRDRAPDEWKLARQLFDRLNATYGPHTIDRFASSATTQVPRYNSRYSDPQAEARNAMTQDWTHEINFIHPPVDMLPEVVQKLREQPCRATVVAPYWPSQMWFQELSSISCSAELLPRAGLSCPLHLQVFGRSGPTSWRLACFHVEGNRPSSPGGLPW